MIYLLHILWVPLSAGTAIPTRVPATIREHVARFGKEVEHSANSTDGTVYLQFFQVCISPFLLFGSGHAHPEQIRLCPVYGGYHGLIVFLGEFRLVGWGIGFYPDIGI